MNIRTRQVGHALKLDNLRTLAHANITFGWLRSQPPATERVVMTMAHRPSDDFEYAALPRVLPQRTNSARAFAAWRAQVHEIISQAL